MNEDRLRVAMQRSGRLADNSRELLHRCGIRFSPDPDRLVWTGENLPVDLMLVRDDDIPGLLADGHCHVGIVGLNLAREAALERTAAGLTSGFQELMPLDFGSCRLALAAPLEFVYDGPASLAGRRIATSYPRVLEDFLRRQEIEAEVVTLSGSVELAPRLGKSDLVCDLVSTGATLAANGLKELTTVLECQATLIRGERSLTSAADELLGRLLQRVQGVVQVRESKYIMLHAPRSALARITELLPGTEAPTVMPLDGRDDRVAVHAVCSEYVFWETLEALKQAGASALLVLPVEKMLA